MLFLLRYSLCLWWPLVFRFPLVMKSAFTFYFSFPCHLRHFRQLVNRKPTLSRKEEKTQYSATIQSQIFLLLRFVKIHAMTTHCSGILCFSVHQRNRAFGGGDGWRLGEGCLVFSCLVLLPESGNFHTGFFPIPQCTTGPKFAKKCIDVSEWQLITVN